MKSLTLKSLVLAASLAFASVSANAAFTVSGDLDSSDTAELYSFLGTSLTPSFSDYITVSFDGLRDFVGTISGNSPGGTIDFSVFNIVSSTDITDTIATGTIDNGAVKFAFADLTGTTFGGTYLLHIAGTKTGASASYTGSLSAISPVPEAETYSMMLAGLGLMGFVARRRKV